VCWSLKFEQEGETVVLDVRGLIYHGDFQFTSHIIGTDGIVWYHDGVTAGSSCEIEGDLTSSLSKIVEVQKETTDFGSVCESLIMRGKWKWVGGWLYILIYFQVLFK